MRKIAENYAANLRQSDAVAASWSGELCLATIGDDLRDCYAEITKTEQPEDLVELARTVDARLDRLADTDA